VRVERVRRHLEAEPRELVALAVDRERVVALRLDEVRKERGTRAARPRRRGTALGGDGVPAARLAAELLAALHAHDDLRRDDLDALVLHVPEGRHRLAAHAARTLTFGDDDLGHLALEVRGKLRAPLVRRSARLGLALFDGRLRYRNDRVLDA